MNHDITFSTVPTLITLSSWCDEAYKHEQAFLQTFAPGGALLLSVSWNADSMYLAVIDENAQKVHHVIDNNEWFEYLKNLV
jgi:hypothetical protein